MYCVFRLVIIDPDADLQGASHWQISEDSLFNSLFTMNGFSMKIGILIKTFCLKRHDKAGGEKFRGNKHIIGG